MGMDIFGINPSFASKRQETEHAKLGTDLHRLQQKYYDNRFSDWHEDDQTMYWELKKKMEELAPGQYFRANIWSWRPLHGLISMVITKNNLPWKYYLWGDNSGKGIKPISMKTERIREIQADDTLSIKERDQYLKHLEEDDYVADNEVDTHCKQLGLLLQEETKSYVGEVWLNTGMWVDKQGRFATEDQLERFKDSIKRVNDQLLLPGPIHPNKSGDIAIADDMLYPAHGTNKEHIDMFVSFLIHCGGFEIC